MTVAPGHGNLLPLEELHRMQESVRAQQASVERSPFTACRSKVAPARRVPYSYP